MNGKVAIVTGGAKGIGAATALLLAHRGAAVVVNDLRSRRQPGLPHQRRWQSDRGPGGRAGQGASGNACCRDRQGVWSGRRHGQQRGHVVREEAFCRFDLGRIRGEVQRRTESRLPHDSGCAASHTGPEQRPGPQLIAHGTSKGALDTVAKYVAQELGPLGITANVVSPGLAETERTAGQPAAFKQRLATMAPLQRIATPEDVAGAIAFFASDDSRFVTGDNVPVNGGSAMD